MKKLGLACCSIIAASAALGTSLHAGGLLAQNGRQDYLFPGQMLVSSSDHTQGCYKTIMQTDGNLVTYNQYGFALWSSHTQGSGGYAVLQRDGNFVIYNFADAVVWATNTVNGIAPLYTLDQQVDGNLVLYQQLDATHIIARWASGIVVHDQNIGACSGGSTVVGFLDSDAPGGTGTNDYKKLFPDQPRSSWCGSFCAADSACHAFTYAPPGTEDIRAVCHLKNVHPSGNPVGRPGFFFGLKG